ncbi:MAG: hypothetical protein R3D67_13495 [Hyphomicrobiaceae bacterium]
MPTYDLILRGARVIDPSQGIDGLMDVGFAGGKAAGVGRDLKLPPPRRFAMSPATSSRRA